MRYIITCRRCGRFLTRPVTRVTSFPELTKREGSDAFEPTVGRGACAVDPMPIGVGVGVGEGTRNCVVVNPSDVRRLAVHPDGWRNCGCCGHDGGQGPNRLCLACRAEVATLRDDCWTPQEVRFEPSAVRLVAIDSGDAVEGRTT